MLMIMEILFSIYSGIMFESSVQINTFRVLGSSFLFYIKDDFGGFWTLIVQASNW